MAVYNVDATLGGVSLKLDTITPTKIQKTRKQVIGKTLTQSNIIGLNAQQWVLNVSGLITGADTTELGTNRASIEALDDAATHAYIDNIHNGTYYVEPGSLSFEDASSDGGMYYKFSMTLIEE